MAILDEELNPIVQEKLQEIQSWINRTYQWFPSPAPPPMPDGYCQPQAPYPAKIQEGPKQSTSTFANTDPSKVVEFKPKGLQLLTPTSPQSRESFAGAPDEDAAVSTIESTQDNAAFETTVDWTSHLTDLSNGDGWITPESNPGTNTGDKQLENHIEGNESTTKFDWAEDADATLPIYPLNLSPPTRPTVDTEKGKGKAVTGNTAEPISQWDWESPSTPEASKQEPAAEITKDIADNWMAENGLSSGSWDVGIESTANGWDDPPKVAEPTGGISFPPRNGTQDSNGTNKNDWDNWGTVPLKGQKSKPVAKKEQERPLKFTPKPKDKDNRFHKGQVERDRKDLGRGGKEKVNSWKGIAGNGVTQGKKGYKPPPTPAKPFAKIGTKIEPAKEKRRDQATDPKDAFTFKRTTATLQGTMKDQDEGPDLPPLPDAIKAKGYPPEFEENLRQAVVPKCRMPDRPSVAPLPENTNSDKGMNWVNSTPRPVWNMDTPKDFSERKVRVDETNETNGWVKRSNSKTSPTESKVENWPKLGTKPGK